MKGVEGREEDEQKSGNSKRMGFSSAGERH